MYHDGLYVPPWHYSACSPLPDDWIEMIPNPKQYDWEIKLFIKHKVFDNADIKDLWGENLA